MSTFTFPSTDVLFKVHVAPAGTVKFATALLLIVLEQFAANPSGAMPKQHAIVKSFKKRFFIDITLLYYEFRINLLLDDFKIYS
ncbi:hypothetical protein D3C75_1133280 [compost metagenome]